MVKTRGRTALDVALGEHGRNQRWLAEKLTISENSVSLWRRGLCRPEHHYRIALMNLLGIDPLSWLTAKERTIAGLPPLEPAPAQAAA